jgi:drug/metabolite transporter (DMT)-like permease
VTPVQNKASQKRHGVEAALASALFFGLTPIFGRQAILAGIPPLTVVMLRTLLAVGLLLFFIFLAYRKYLYIYPAGFLGCFLAGAINGIGSLFYYSALARINASLGQLLYSLYPFFILFWLWIDHQPPSRLTILRLFLVLPAIFLLTYNTQNQVDLVGVAEMIIAAVLYAAHLPINQRVLYDVPAPTVTLYTLLSMSLVVTPAALISHYFALGGKGLLPTQTGLGSIDSAGWWAVVGLAIATFVARIALFFGVKRLGGLQTAMLGLSELLITMICAWIFLHESFSKAQWAGAALLAASLTLVAFEKPAEIKRKPEGLLRWLHPPGIIYNAGWQTRD